MTQQGQMTGTIKLAADQSVILVYVHADSTPLVQIIKGEPPDFMEVGIQKPTKVAGPNGQPIMGPVEQVKLVKALDFPAVPLAVYFSKEQAQAVAARDDAIKDEDARGAARAIGADLRPTLAAIRKLPESREAVDRPAPPQ